MDRLIDMETRITPEGIVYHQVELCKSKKCTSHDCVVCEYFTVLDLEVYKIDN